MSSEPRDHHTGDYPVMRRDHRNVPSLRPVGIDNRAQEVVVAASDRVVPYSQLEFEKTRGDIIAIPMIRHFDRTIAGTVRADLEYIRLFIAGFDIRRPSWMHEAYRHDL